MQFFLGLFLLSLFIIKAPPFYVFPIASRLFSSHTVAKLIIVMAFFVFYILYKTKINKLIKENKALFILIFLYFVGQSLSILTASDVVLFWKNYHNVIINILIFLLGFFIVAFKQRVSRTIFNFILLTGGILISFELLFFLFPAFILPVLKIVIQKEVLDSYLTNLARGRILHEINNEIFLPFFLIWFLSKRNFSIKTILAIFFVAALIYLSFISNFRGRVLLMVFLLVGFIFTNLFKREQEMKTRWLVAFLVISFFVIAIFSITTSNIINAFNILDRFALSDKTEDIVTLDFRISAIEKSIDTFRSSSIFGIGLGNYVDQELLKWKFIVFPKDYIKNYIFLGTAYSPHNVLFQTLAETGFIGFIPLVLLLGYFLNKDRRILKSNRNLFLIPYILSSWAIFLFMNFNPGSTIFISGWFWFLRGVIVGKKGYL